MILKSKTRGLKFGWLFLVFLSFSATAQTAWKVKSSDISFKIKNAGFNVSGKFSGLVAKIILDETNYANSIIEASIDVNSIDTGINMRDNHLRKPEYFDVVKYPKISIKLLKLTNSGKENLTGSFQLTIKSVTKTVEIPFSLTENKAGKVIKGEFSIDRRDYEVGGNSLTMSDKVTVFITLDIIK